jgi:hypothetical protein
MTYFLYFSPFSFNTFYFSPSSKKKLPDLIRRPSFEGPQTRVNAFRNSKKYFRPPLLGIFVPLKFDFRPLERRPYISPHNAPEGRGTKIRIRGGRKSEWQGTKIGTKFLATLQIPDRPPLGGRKIPHFPAPPLTRRRSPLPQDRPRALPRAFATLADGRRPYLRLRRGSPFLFDLLFFLAALGKRPPKGRAEAAARGSERVLHASTK